MKQLLNVGETEVYDSTVQRVIRCMRAALQVKGPKVWGPRFTIRQGFAAP